MITSPLHLTALIAVVCAVSFWLDRRFVALSRIGASLLAIGMGAVLANLGIVPESSPVYDIVAGPLTSLAIVWLLLAVNLKDLRRAGGRMLGAFALAVTGTAAGVGVAAAAFAARFGSQNPALAGTLMGTYSGGSVNFISVGRGLDLGPRLFAAATAADNVTTALWLAANIVLPVALARWFPWPVPRGVTGKTHEAHHPFFDAAPLSASHLALLLAIGLTLVTAAAALGRAWPIVQPVVWLTTLALAVGHLPPVARLRGSMQMGNLALNLFFVGVGIHSRVDRILAVGLSVFFYTLLVVAVHGVVVYGVGRLLRLDLGTLTIASQAAIGGPSSAIAVAAGRGWQGLVLPGIIVGLLGYAVGTYLGFGIAAVVSAFT
ncbi:MAG: DUF819 family protein [Acidobacteriota bacterium]